MKLKMYCVYDCKTRVYQPPIYAQNDAHARRIFGMAFSRTDTMYSFAPEDFSICEVGEFDDETGLLFSSGKPRFVCESVTLLPTKEQVNKVE